MFGAVLSKIDGTEFIYDDVLDNSGVPKEYSYKHILPKVINQGSDPICVPCSISSWLNWKINTIYASNKDNKIKLFDIFENGNGGDDGMTCKAAFKYLIDCGAKYDNGNYKLSKYYKINSGPALKHALISNGPCVAVLPVYNESLEFWKNYGENFLGYHAISIVGYDEKGFIIRNSWGESFGRKGYTYIKNEDLNKFVEIWTLC